MSFVFSSKKGFLMSSIDILSLAKLKKRLIEIYKRKSVPDKNQYLDLLEKVIETLKNENSFIREYDKNGLPGGVIELKKDISTIIVPDLHARVDFFLNILFYNINNSSAVLEELIANRLQVVCVGDGFHAEARAVKRWEAALEEFMSDYARHSNMDEEMRESLGVMEMVMEMKVNFPDNFHFLKGNHENILNENGEGNFPFRKFALEGPMVLRYVEKFYGDYFLTRYSAFEKNLPLLAVGDNFVISHSEPFDFLSREEVINFRYNHNVIEALTWTENNASKKNSVIEMLKHYLKKDNVDDSFYFGGHRPVQNLYNLRASGRYVQIHNPSKFVIAYIKAGRPIDLYSDIIELNDNTKNILKISF